MKTRVVTCALLMSIMLPVAAVAEADSASGAMERCAREAGGTSDDLLRFDRDLRGALAHDDVALLALLVKFPLAVNYPDGVSILLRTPVALQAMYDVVFAPAVRGAVKMQKPEGMFCDYTGIGYGAGVVWVSAVGSGDVQRYAVVTVNVPTTPAFVKPDRRRSPPVFTCTSKDYRLLVENSASGAVRARFWNRKQSLAEAPQLDLRGTETGEGTGPCWHPLWSFKQKSIEYVISKRGCDDGSPPHDSAASLEIRGAGAEPSLTWCY